VSYRVELMPRAERDLRALPAEAQKRIARAIHGLAQEPKGRDTALLRGGPKGLRRFRAGAYRGAYSLDDKARLVRVWRIGHRSTFYKRLKR